MEPKETQKDPKGAPKDLLRCFSTWDSERLRHRPWGERFWSRAHSATQCPCNVPASCRECINDVFIISLLGCFAGISFDWMGFVFLNLLDHFLI